MAIPPWQRRKGGRVPLVSIEQSAVCCPPVLTGRPVYHRLPGENEGFRIQPTTEPVVLLGSSGADFLNSTMSATGVLGYPVALDIMLSKFTLLFNSLYPRVFDVSTLRFPANVVRGFIVADFFGQVYILLDDEEVPSSMGCAKIDYTAIVLYEFSTDSERVTSVVDRRVFNRTRMPVAAWFTEFFDDLFQEKRENIETFFDDYLNPTTAGHFALPCDAVIRTTYDTPIFRQVRDLWDLDYVSPGVTGQVYEELRYYATIAHGILDWLGQHFGIPWTPGYSLYAQPGDTTFYLSLGQKRAMLRNAFNYDQVLELNTGELYQYPFSNFPGQDLWSIATWRGINFAKGSIQVLNFVFDVLGLYGQAPRKPVTSTTPPVETIYYWDTDPKIWSGSTQQWNLPSADYTPGDNSYTYSIAPYFEPTADDYVTPLRPQMKYDSVVSGGFYQVYSYNIADAGRTYTKQPGSAQAVYRVPLYWARDGIEWRAIEYALDNFANSSVLIGYRWFLPNISRPGDPTFNYDQCELIVESQPFLNDQDYVEYDFYTNSVDIVELFQPTFQYDLFIQPPLDSPYPYEVVGPVLHIGALPKRTEVVRVVFASKRSLIKYTKWIRFTN